MLFDVSENGFPTLVNPKDCRLVQIRANGDHTAAVYVSRPCLYWYIQFYHLP